MRSKIEKLKHINHRKHIIEGYRIYGSKEEIRFDDNWHLFGFNNCVYDMKERRIREYRNEDMVSMTTGYDWIEPTEEEVEKVRELIRKIMPDEKERETLLNVMCTCIDGRCLERFIF